jgi:hypothetical protein
MQARTRWPAKKICLPNSLECLMPSTKYREPVTRFAMCETDLVEKRQQSLPLFRSPTPTIRSGF